jgi:hypothetical protein
MRSSGRVSRCVAFPLKLALLVDRNLYRLFDLAQWLGRFRRLALQYGTWRRRGTKKMRKLISALLVSAGVTMGAALSAGTAEAAAFSNPAGLSGAPQASDAVTQVRYRHVRPRFGMYFGFHVGPRYPRYWFPGPYYDYGYPGYYYYPYYDVPRYYRRCWRSPRTGRSVCRWYRRW